jgi:hypothetical protein
LFAKSLLLYNLAWIIRFRLTFKPLQKFKLGCFKHEAKINLHKRVFHFKEGYIHMDTKEVIEKIKELAPQGRISCAAARQLAEKLKIEYAEVGKACDAAGIKVCGCELGCF